MQATYDDVHWPASTLAKDSNSQSTTVTADDTNHDEDSGKDGRGSPRGRRRKADGSEASGKWCGVCGDRAISRNFGALTCETCKAFFRRNALKRESQQCVFGGLCVITKTTRRFCPACRLQKCIAIGMLPQLIRLEPSNRGGGEKKRGKFTDRKSTLQEPVADDSSAASLSSASPPAANTNETPVACSPWSATSPYLSESSPMAPSSLEELFQAEVAGFSPLAEELKGKGNSNTQQSLPHCWDSARGAPFSVSGSGSVDRSVHEADLFDSEARSASQADVFHSNEQSLNQVSTPDSNSHLLRQAIAPSSDVRSVDQADSSNSVVYSVNEADSAGSVPNQTRAQGGGDPRQPSSATAVNREQTQHCCCRMSRLGMADFQHVSRSELPSDMMQYWLLKEEERRQLTHLSSVYQEVLATVGDQECGGEKVLDGPLSVEDYMFAMDKVFHWCVYFAKCIPHFQKLPQVDQIATIKASTFVCHGIAMTTVYLPERKLWDSIFGPVGVGHVPTSILPRDILQDVEEFCCRLKLIAKNDFTIYALLHCIVIFDPRESFIEDRQLINQFRDEYVILLKHYLESQYSFQHADAYFSALMDLLVKGGKKGREAMHMIRQTAEATFEPLTAEILSVD